MKLNALASELKGWHEERFPLAEPTHVFIKAVEELGEVAKALNAAEGKNYSSGTHEHLAEEVADVFICLLVLLRRYFPHINIDVALLDKADQLVDPRSDWNKARPR